jgi:hypothetical protein
VYDRFSELENRIEESLKAKTNKKYRGVDVLLVGVKDWFVARLCTGAEYADLKRKITQQVQAQLAGSIFKELAIVDTDFVGKGHLLLFSNIHSARLLPCCQAAAGKAGRVCRVAAPAP